MRCTCVECYENKMLEVLGGPLALYQSLKYRELRAECSECGGRYCPKALFHGNRCENV